MIEKSNSVGREWPDFPLPDNPDEKPPEPVEPNKEQ